MSTPTTTTPEPFAEGGFFEDDGTGFVNTTTSAYMADVENFDLTMELVEMAGPYTRVSQGSSKVMRFVLRAPDGSIVDFNETTVIEWSLAKYRGETPLLTKLLSAGSSSGIVEVATGTIDVTITAEESLQFSGQHVHELKAKIDNYSLDRFVGIVDFVPSSGGVLG